MRTILDDVLFSSSMTVKTYCALCSRSSPCLVNSSPSCECVLHYESRHERLGDLWLPFSYGCYIEHGSHLCVYDAVNHLRVHSELSGLQFDTANQNARFVFGDSEPVVQLIKSGVTGLCFSDINFQVCLSFGRQTVQKRDMRQGPVMNEAISFHLANILTVVFHAPSNASTTRSYCSLSEVSKWRVTLTAPVFGSMENGSVRAETG